MDTKVIAFGIAVIAASIGGSAIVGGGKETKVIIAASEKPVDVALAEVVRVTPQDSKNCERVRVGTDKGVILQWACGGAVMPTNTQTELDKLATADAVSIAFTERVVDGKSVMDAKVQEGVLPNLDPAPEPEPESKAHPAR